MSKIIYLINLIIILLNFANSQTPNCNNLAPTDSARLTCQFLSMSDNAARVF